MRGLARAIGEIALDVASTGMLVVAVVSLRAALALDPHPRRGALGRGRNSKRGDYV